MAPFPPPASEHAPGATDRDDAELARDGATHPSVADTAGRLVGAIDSVVAGHHDVAEIAVATLLAGGNLLIEDIPGVGKTLLAQVLARAVGGSFGRIQGTPDLLPGDVTGSMMPVVDAAGNTVLEFRPGPVFRHVVVFDELNRATARTQSALLEAAEESTVTVDGTTHHLPDPFFLVATQNPVEIAGTYGLGEGALDRFSAVVTPGRAAPEFELEVLTGRRGRSMLAAVEAVASTDAIVELRREVASVQLSEAVGAYVLRLLEETRRHPRVRLGASTRAGVSLIALARARAAMQGRSYVVPDDVATLATAALGHRVLVAGGDGSTTAGREIVEGCLAQVAPPTP
ncbi:AAA family ATPase [Ilumatobacter sp.]|uniref:AAA family ATPase n=1 Tax=Ilumatobacter sp. TaxID=1967498 RepID=UPI003B52BD7D